MRALFTALLILTLSWAQMDYAEECAANLNDLSKTERLRAVAHLLPQDANSAVGFANETKGSYFVIRTNSHGDFSVSFYTSGLFELYPIKREGPVTFCDNGKMLLVIGLGRKESIRPLSGGGLELGDGGPKKRFKSDTPPERLAELHRITGRNLASDSMPRK